MGTISRNMTIGEVFSALGALEEIFRFDTVYPVQVAWKMVVAKRKLGDVADYALARLGKLIDGFGERELTENENIVYQSVMMSYVEVEIPGFSEEEFTQVCGKVEVTTETVEGLMALCTE